MNNFQTAQEAIREASAAAAEAAKTNIKDVQDKATRIELSVKLKVNKSYTLVPHRGTPCADSHLALDFVVPCPPQFTEPPNQRYFWPNSDRKKVTYQ